ncbi:trypsin-like peptidase domain-containing protein [Candidatus Thiothrix anitrata]|jgi:serine protease Do|uniref:Probable periplasmic serine endoprotease DegP-like n=1 Tax=Candidatus Thiothrix anitrata TaxID=2823902 RepID=A0ABX7X2T7_9GAMM|nr:trypsin-like peptidase domain-containing protein [Candidatus Thiothrix anitrata]QTR49592.1 trypsin-like peptidase domain-containing protein [Candidatus Thiothrix anitrata]
MSHRFLSALLLVCCLAVTNLQARDLPDFTRLVKANSSAVVNISSQMPLPAVPATLQDKPSTPEADALFDELMRRLLEEGGGTNPFSFDGKAHGSGFVYSADGYIVTNHHVVNKAVDIKVKLSDGREFPAHMMGSDERTDLALLKVEAQGLPVLKLGNSNKLEVGEWVLAIGSPFGFEHSATAGIVSAKGRSLPNGNYVPFIQTDVAINPGNSGSPLFNLKGQVVGINSQIYSSSGGFAGVSFAIPIDTARDVMQQLKTKGRVSRGWLGIYIGDVDAALAQRLQLPSPRGALVTEVLPASSAIGVLQANDVIMAYEGKPLVNAAALPLLVGATTLGKTVNVHILRDGQARMVQLTIAELPNNGELEGVNATQ